MNKDTYFHFTLGPVQSFVGQSRRTRDFWAGSFLLSWLSGIAMQSVIKQGGVIQFPKEDKNFLMAIEKGGNTKSPQQGKIPNRFKALVNDGFCPEKVVDNVRNAWKSLAQKIYENEVKKHAKPENKNIWDNQVNHFWDMSWVLVDEKSDSSCLDRRKNWRSHYTPNQSGIKCSLMGDWQEISGIDGVSQEAKLKREEFWSKLSNVNKTDFDDKEFLCAISYVKRRFVHHFSDFNVQLEGFVAHGWSVPVNVPSVDYIAAAPWLASVLSDSDGLKDFECFFETAKNVCDLNEWNTNINCVEVVKCNKEFKKLDGRVFHINELDNLNRITKREDAQETKKYLKKLIEKYGEISPYYAVLMMDGDRLGKQMSDETKAGLITDGLSGFTNKVPSLVYENDGFLIYAGGDDVLALLPLEKALACALSVREYYEKCFKESKSKHNVETSISAAIIYTHIRHPLKNIIKESHDLLDDIAKENAGRNAIAVRVYKGSGQVIEWAKQWDSQDGQNKFPALSSSETSPNKYVLHDLLEKYKKSDDENKFSSKFFYKIRQRFDLISESGENYLNYDDVIELMSMEYVKSIGKSNFSMSEARDFIKPLMEQSYNASSQDNKITADAALLVRFLAQKGIEE